VACSAEIDRPLDRHATTEPSTIPPTSVTGDSLVFRDVTVVDASGVRAHRWVVVQGDRISAVLDAPPDGGTAVDGVDGLWLTPGLIDPHVHLTLSGTTTWVGDTLADALRAHLRHGVTTVVDAGGPEETFGLRDRIAAGDLVGPSLRALGPMLTTPLSHPCETFPDPDRCAFAETAVEGVAHADWLASAGADGLKAAITDTSATPWPTPRLSEDVLAAAVDALPSGMLRFAHVDTARDALAAAAAGIEVLAHPCFVDEATPDVLALDLWVHSTLGAFSGLPRIADGLPLDPTSDTVPAVVLNSWAASADAPSLDDPETRAAWEAWNNNARAHVAALVATGSPFLVPASDAGYAGVWHGVGLHAELASLADLGMPPLEGLTAATSRAAESAGLADRGRVEAGMRADLLVLDRDPLADLDALRTPARVVVGGVVWTDEELATVDLLVRADSAPVDAFCLDDRDCASAVCDRTLHRCTDDCARPFDPGETCGPTSSCAPIDGLVTTEDGACIDVWHPCTLYGDDCAPEAYGESCVPIDLDTAACVPTGPQGQGDSCLAAACASGLYCSPIDGRCWTLCDPATPSCPVPSTCQGQTWEGEPWFGLCLP
jgi:imidazolonepropionase-like amidohydrolase